MRYLGYAILHKTCDIRIIYHTTNCTGKRDNGKTHNHQVSGEEVMSSHTCTGTQTHQLILCLTLAHMGIDTQPNTQLDEYIGT